MHIHARAHNEQRTTHTETLIHTQTRTHRMRAPCEPQPKRHARTDVCSDRRLSVNVQARTHTRSHKLPYTHPHTPIHTLTHAKRHMLWHALTDPHAQTRTGIHHTRARAPEQRRTRNHHEWKKPCTRTHTAAAPPPPGLLATCPHGSCGPELAWRLTACRLTADGALQARRKLQDARTCQWRPRGRRVWRSVRRCQAHMRPQRSLSRAGLRWTVRHCPERDPEPPLELVQCAKGIASPNSWWRLSDFGRGR